MNVTIKSHLPTGRRAALLAAAFWALRIWLICASTKTIGHENHKIITSLKNVKIKQTKKANCTRNKSRLTGSEKNGQEGSPQELHDHSDMEEDFWL